MKTRLIDTFVLYCRINEIDYVLDVNNNRITSDTSYANKFYKKVIENTFINDLKNPFFVWRGIGYIHQLDNITFTPDVINYINKKGLSIYLYELSVYCDSNNNVYDTPKSTDTLQSYISRNYRNLFYEFNIENHREILTAEFESIKKFVTRVGLTNVKVHSCHWNIDKFFQDRYKCFEIVSDNVCLPMLVNYINNLYPDKKIQKSQELKRFICPLWRYSSARHLLAAYMISKNNTYLSWHYKGSYEIFEKNLWFSFDSLDKDLKECLIVGIDRLENESPLIIDSVTDGSFVELDGIYDFLKHPPGYEGYYIENTLEQYYAKSFCAVVSETIYAQPFATFSEKTMIAMKCKTPFVMVGAPHTLSNLKSYGFKTFDRWWDESYDLEEDHVDRLYKIFKTLDYISNLSDDQIQEIFVEMKEILDHNYKLVSDVNTFDILKRFV